MIQSFLTFDSMARSLKCDHSWQAVGQYFTVVFFLSQNLSILDMALCVSEVKGLTLPFIGVIVYTKASLRLMFMGASLRHT